MPLPWARQLIANATGPIPEYGSAEWRALPDDSREKVAACIVAAECWRTYTDPAEVAWRLRADLGAREDDPDDARWSPEAVAEVHRTASRPSYAELCRRRGEPAREERAQRTYQRLGLVPSA